MINIRSELESIRVRLEREFGIYIEEQYHKHCAALGVNNTISDLYIAVDDCQCTVLFNGKDTVIDINYVFENGEPEALLLTIGNKVVTIANDTRDMTHYQLNLRVIRHLINENENGDVE